MSSSPWPTGIVTFLFTDIEGSTRLWERYPSSMPAALAQHDELLRRAVETHRGVIVKTTGDGLLAAFAGAADGAAATLVAQESLAAADWGETGPLRVRMGLHSGEAQHRDGDYFGPTLNRAARLMAIGAGGQVLLSGAAAALAQAGLPGGAELLDLGMHRLKDLETPEHVYQLATPSVRADFPPLKSLGAYAHNLPVQLTSFVGRERELADVKRLLGTTRLLTLVGPGGTGKTRLSMQAAADVLDQFADGVWFVELAPLTDPGLIVQAVARVFHAQEQPGRSLLDVVTDYLRSKRLLIVLDNCEHLIAAAASLSEQILQSAPGVRILASSREGLAVAGEVTYPVPSLSMPDARAAAPAEMLMQYESVRLFVERAQAARPSFVLTPANAAAIAQICQRVDGIPLAIELAAARVNVLPAEQIAERLRDHFRLLSGGSRTAMPRQQTLQALIDWSWRLLSDDERCLLRRLSVFAGGWALEAAEAVVCDENGPGIDVLDGITALVNKSLVAVSQQADGGMHYRLLETIRQYGRDRLAQAGETAALRNRHAAYFAQVGREVGPQLDGPDLVATLDRLDSESDNLAAALEWLLDSDAETAMRLASDVWMYWTHRGRGGESVRWMSLSLERLRNLPPTDGAAGRTHTVARALTLAKLAAAQLRQGDVMSTEATVNEALELARAAGDAHALVFALGVRAIRNGLWGDARACEAIAEQILAQPGEQTGGWPRAVGLASIAPALAYHGRANQARRYLVEAARSARAINNPWVSAMVAMGTAQLAATEGEIPAAITGFEHAATLFKQIGDATFFASARSDLAHSLRRSGQAGAALAVYRETLPLWQELGNRGAVANQLECFAYLATAARDTRRTVRLLGAAAALREAVGAPMTLTEQAEYDAALADARAQLGAPVFDDTMAAGRATTMDEAISDALANSAYPARTR